MHYSNIHGGRLLLRMLHRPLLLLLLLAVFLQRHFQDSGF